MTQPPNPPYGTATPGGYGAPPPAGPFYLNVLGHEQGPLDLAQLLHLARANRVRPDTLVRPARSEQYFAARDVPGLYSDKEWLTAVLLAWFLGMFAVDRFYLGYTNLAIAKLCVSIFTCLIGGVIWQVVDLVLILVRSVPDAQGRPLR